MSNFSFTYKKILAESIKNSFLFSFPCRLVLFPTTGTLNFISNVSHTWYVILRIGTINKGMYNFYSRFFIISGSRLYWKLCEPLLLQFFPWALGKTKPKNGILIYPQHAIVLGHGGKWFAFSLLFHFCLKIK